MKVGVLGVAGVLGSRGSREVGSYSGMGSRWALNRGVYYAPESLGAQGCFQYSILSLGRMPAVSAGDPGMTCGDSCAIGEKWGMRTKSEGGNVCTL